MVLLIQICQHVGVVWIDMLLLDWEYTVLMVHIGICVILNNLCHFFGVHHSVLVLGYLDATVDAPHHSHV